MNILLLVFMLCNTPNYILATNGNEILYASYKNFKKPKVKDLFKTFLSSVPSKNVEIKYIHLPYECTYS